MPCRKKFKVHGSHFTVQFVLTLFLLFAVLSLLPATNPQLQTVRADWSIDTTLPTCSSITFNAASPVKDVPNTVTITADATSTTISVPTISPAITPSCSAQSSNVRTCTWTPTAADTIYNFSIPITDSAGNINTCPSSIKACAATYGTACTMTSAANTCGQTASNTGTILCSGACSVSTPAVPANPVGYGTACESPANSCGTKTPGTITCSGACSATTAPADPVGYGTACTMTSSGNNCGKTASNTGTILCSGACSVSAPAKPADAVRPAPPSWCSPSGNITPGVRNMAWESVTGAGSYYVRMDDTVDPWYTPGLDVYLDLYAGTTYSYNFQTNHTYNMWVHSVAANCPNGSIYSSPVSCAITGCAANYGTACESPANSCGTKTPGTITCSGACSATTAPADPVGYGTACTMTSSGNNCGKTASNTGTILCSGACSVSAPAKPADAVRPAPPSWCSPSGNITPGVRNMAWEAVAGVPSYYVKMTNTTVPGYDVNQDFYTGTTYSFNFLANRTYSMWVNSIAANCPDGSIYSDPVACSITSCAANYGTACTSSANACGTTNSGTITCGGGACSATTPSDACPPTGNSASCPAPAGGQLTSTATLYWTPAVSNPPITYTVTVYNGASVVATSTTQNSQIQFSNLPVSTPYDWTIKACIGAECSVTLTKNTTPATNSFVCPQFPAWIKTSGSDVHSNK